MLVLAMWCAALCGLAQLCVLGALTRSVRLNTLWLAVGAGLVGAGVLTAVLQLAGARAVAGWSGAPLADVVRTASYTSDPVVEELAKLLPAAILLVAASARSRRGRTDVVLLSAAGGAGFGLLEALLRYSTQAGSALRVHGGWVVPWSLPPPLVPTPAASLHSWLPAPADVDTLHPETVGGAGPGFFVHLGWSAVAGFGLGQLVLGRGRRRWLGVLPVLLVTADHMAYNVALQAPATSTGAHRLAAPLLAVQPSLRWWPLVAVVVAVLLDARALRRGDAAAPGLRLHRGVDGPPGLLRLAGARLPLSAAAVNGFVVARRSARYAAARGSSDLVAEVAAFARGLEQRSDDGAWPRLGRPRPLGRAVLRAWPLLLWLLVLLPAGVYEVLGSTPGASGVQRAMARPGPFRWALVLPAGLSVLLVLWRVVSTARAVHRTRGPARADGVSLLWVRSLTGVGSIAFAGLLLWAHHRGVAPGEHVVTTAHALDALSAVLLVTGVALLVAAVVFFPPSIGLVPVVVGEAAVLVPAVSMSSAFVTTALLGGIGIAYSKVGDDEADRLREQPASRGQRPRPGQPHDVPDMPQKPPRPWPGVRNRTLLNIFRDAWKGTTNPNRIGDGTTMDAVRNERATGRMTGGKFHEEKLQVIQNGLKNWLKTYQKIGTPEDVRQATKLLQEVRGLLREATR